MKGSHIWGRDVEGKFYIDFSQLHSRTEAGEDKSSKKNPTCMKRESRKGASIRADC